MEVKIEVTCSDKDLLIKIYGGPQATRLFLSDIKLRLMDLYIGTYESITITAIKTDA